MAVLLITHDLGVVAELRRRASRSCTRAGSSSEAPVADAVRAPAPPVHARRCCSSMPAARHAPRDAAGRDPRDGAATLDATLPIGLPLPSTAALAEAALRERRCRRSRPLGDGRRGRLLGDDAHARRSRERPRTVTAPLVRAIARAARSTSRVAARAASARARALRPGGRRRRPRRSQPGRDARPRRRVRLRQVDARPAAAAAARADGGRDRASTASTSSALAPARAAARCAATCRSSSRTRTRRSNPRMTRRRHRRRGPARSTASATRRRARATASRELLERVGLGREAARPLPARVLRRPAPAHRHRARARAAAGVHRRRRAGLGARRVDPGADPEPAAGAAASELGLTYLFIAHDLARRRAHLPTASR